MPGRKNTFGSGLAAETLVDRLEGNDKLFRRVSSFYCDYNKTMHTFEILCVSDGHFWKNILHLYIKERFEYLKTLLTVEQGQTYLRNIMTVKKRHVMSIVDEIIRIERRRRLKTQQSYNLMK